ncbi:MAG: 7-carboxy-7-deazaguanine synthase QueE [Bacteroidetes bacterium]|nr:MAG: 7-carboxy-7-deazaguanine synthase QueE [Bacteroidota bacterium]
MERKNLPGKGEGELLPLVEQFYTLQGEGFHTGKAAYFIRIGGCDIGCRWCDSKISWSPGIHRLVSVDEILEKVLATPARSVVVTGGEPSLYNLNPLCNKLKAHNIETFIETSGAYKLTGTWDWICLSPKQNLHPDKSMYNRADELKIIVYEDDDIKWAEECAKRVPDSCILYLQPEWSRFAVNIGKIVDYAKNNPQWMVSLQSHKFMKIP